MILKAILEKLLKIVIIIAKGVEKMQSKEIKIQKFKEKT